MCRVTAGIVFFNIAGPVRDFQYQPVVEWLVADLTRIHGIVCGPSPYVFHRVGIPGSGGPHYHRRDWEPIYCFAKPASLPPRWSDNTATGHPPKWAPSGEMSHRLPNGSKRDQWGRDRSTGNRAANGERKKQTNNGLINGKKIDGGRGGKIVTRRKANGLRGEPAGTGTCGKKDGDTQTVDGVYYPPVLANSGNKIMESYTAAEVETILGEPHDVRLLKVGGGLMGSNIAHESEAPFPETLIRFFIVSYCPPGGIVLDPFCGSGTTCSVAVQENRNAIGIDIRDGNGGLASARKRLDSVTPLDLLQGNE
jgi:hypothetical protein